MTNKTYSDMNIEELEAHLDQFDPDVRTAALQELAKRVERGNVQTAKESDIHNTHCHTFYSYNAYGYSPARIAWIAKKMGFRAVGIVDFDVLDGLDEFVEACALLKLRGCVGIESRVFVPEFADLEVNSPGEPGIAYHMGVGMTRSQLTGGAAAYLAKMRQQAAQRNKELLQRVNEFLSPVQLDYEQDVIPLTPSGNATERHICLAFARKAAAHFDTPDDVAAYWREKIGVDDKIAKDTESAALQNAIRAKTMKQGGVGYVQPGSDSFPEMRDMNRFVIESGGIPTVAWLNGLSKGEQQMDRYLNMAVNYGVAGLAIIPDRNYSPGVKDEKLKNLYSVVSLAKERGIPIFVGTEMNSPGLKVVDDFDSEELKPLLPEFVRGAYIAYGHTLLEKSAGFGFCSMWALDHTPDLVNRSTFYEKIGRTVAPGEQMPDIASSATPEEILKLINA